MKTYLVVAFGAMLVALVVTPLAMRVACWMGILDAPGTRKVHRSPIPRTGGIAIVVGMLALVVPVLALDNTIGESFRGAHVCILALVFGGLTMFLVGLVDDIRGLRARTKLSWQIVAAGAMCAFGIRVEEVALPGNLVIEFGPLAVPLTMLWIIGVTNALNLIDGLDGLAAGIASIACTVLAVLAILSGEAIMAVLMLALLGSLIGFLTFNFNPAHVFMGDCGSLFVGFTLGTASALCAMKTATAVALGTAFLPLAIPLLDMVFSMVRRLLERRSPFAPDRGHIHHRLLSLGLSHSRAVLVLYGVSTAAAGLGLFMLTDHGMFSFALFPVALLLLVGVFRLVGAIRLRESIAAFRRNLAIAQEASGERRCFEESQLRLREAESFDHWWDCVCDTAERLSFGLISMTLTRSDGEMHELIWQRHQEETAGPRLLRMTFHLGDGGVGRPVFLEAHIGVNGSLEAAARRGALFSRLIDEHQPWRIAPPHHPLEPGERHG